MSGNDSFQIVYDAQLSPQVVAGTQTRTGLEPSTPVFGGKCANQYTMIASLGGAIYSTQVRALC